MWAQGEIWWCIKDQIHHTIIPVIGYVLAGFAAMTILMKNSLLDNLGADYVRTAFAKGLSEKRVIYMHALRNSLIPICVGIGHAIGLLFAGSFLIERTCNIPGMGLLGYMSLIERDYPVLMGILVFLVLIRLTGNLLSDLVLALVDPRVRFK
jgi:microcin C transport system permease protein